MNLQIYNKISNLKFVEKNRSAESDKTILHIGIA